MEPAYERGLFFGIAMVAALIVGNAAVAYRNTRQLDEDAGWVAHTHDVLGQISEVLRVLVDSETGQRGFLLTGQAELLQPYNGALARLDNQIAALKYTTSDNPRQQKNIGELRVMVTRHLALLREGIDQAQGRDNNHENMNIKNCEQQMVMIRELIDRMRQEELSLLKIRNDQSRKAYLYAIIGGILGPVLGLLMMGGLAVSVKRNQLIRNVAAEKIRKVHAELEEQAKHLRRTTEALARSNLDLQQFAYVASHDLQEPLRGVSGCVQVLQKRYQGQLDGRGDELINHTVEGVTRMQTLINDLLAFSRVDTGGKAGQRTDCNVVLHLVLANLQVAIQEVGAIVTHGALPVVGMDPGQMKQLLQNLIGNAIKFHGTAPPRIHVAAERRNGEWTFFVKDNGIGIESEYFDRIFAIFQRLHARNEYAGTGIGLAICKKIVERNGGRMWVESEPGKGSTFFFTILEKGVNG